MPKKSEMRGGEKFYQRRGNTRIKTLQNKKHPKQWRT